jgi:uncharacterized membrane protein YphA (DoxX/SURF4 family)
MSFLQRILRSEWLAIRSQVALGIIFAAAAWPKLVDPPTFAKNIWAYAMLPDWLINLKALALPGIELLVGLALLTGIQRRAGAWLALLMLVMFTAAIAFNIVVENPLNCSCFELNPKPKTCATLLREMKWEVVRDLGMLLLAVHVVWIRRGAPDVPKLDAAA